MSVAKLRRRINEKLHMPRLGKSPSTLIDVDTGEALCDLADRAYEAASHLRDREHADYADGYDQSATLSAQHAAELEDCLARLDEGTPVDRRPTVDLDDESGG